MPNRRWSDLGGAQKGTIILSGMVQAGLLAAAAFINYVGPISYP